MKPHEPSGSRQPRIFDTPQTRDEDRLYTRSAAHGLLLAPSMEGGAVTSAYVASIVSVSPTPAFDVFHTGEFHSMYVRAEA